MILFSNPGGMLGRLIAQRLGRFDNAFAVLSDHPERTRAMAQQHGQDLEVRDAQGFTQRGLRRALHDVSVLLLLGRGHRVDEEAEAALLRAARHVGVHHVVRVSMFAANVHAHSEVLRRHGRRDDALARSGLRHTILQPHLYQQDLLEFAADVREGKDLLDPTGGASIPYVDVRDVAESTVSVLTQVVHRGQRHVLSGPKSWGLKQVAELLSYNVGHRVRARPIDVESFAHHLLQNGHDVDAATEIALLLTVQDDAQATDAVSRLTGMPPRALESFLLDHRGMFAAQGEARPEVGVAAVLTNPVTWKA